MLAEHIDERATAGVLEKNRTGVESGGSGAKLDGKLSGREDAWGRSELGGTGQDAHFRALQRKGDNRRKPAACSHQDLFSAIQRNQHSRFYARQH